MYRFRLPTPTREALSNVAHFRFCKASTDVVSAEGIRSNQRANAKGHVFDAWQMRQALLAAMLA
jgi:hypothetical protein